MNKQTKTFKKIAKEIGLVIVVAIVVFVSIDYFISVSEKKSERNRLDTIQIGNQIVSALEEYKSKNGYYPKTLEEFESVPDPKWGDQWVYKYFDEDNSFDLSVGYKKKEGSYHPVMYYDYGDEYESTDWLYDH